MDIPTWVKAARKHKGLTQEQLATRLEVTKANISAWEKGRHEPSFARLQKIASITAYPLLTHDEGAKDRQAPSITDFFPSIHASVWGGLTDREKTMVEMKVKEAIQLVISLRSMSEGDQGDSSGKAQTQLEPALTAAPHG